MGRLTLVLFAFTLVVNPDFRSRAEPYAAWALDPAYEWLAEARVAEIARALQTERSAGNPAPGAAGLSAFVNAYFQRPDAALDPWGHPYFLATELWTTHVASAGRDGERATDDDILSPPMRATD